MLNPSGPRGRGGASEAFSPLAGRAWEGDAWVAGLEEVGGGGRLAGMVRGVQSRGREGVARRAAELVTRASTGWAREG